MNQKKLVAGDSIVFLRAENGDLCVGIRRAKKGIGGGPEFPSSGWNQVAPLFGGGGSGGFLCGSEGNLVMRKSGDDFVGRVAAESVVEAVSCAVNGRPFEVVYYPRASTPEFCVKASGVRAAMQTQWCSGMRFKMPFETEDSSRISWFMGTISSVQLADPIRWPDSPWRLLQVLAFGSSFIQWLEFLCLVISFCYYTCIICIFRSLLIGCVYSLHGTDSESW